MSDADEIVAELAEVGLLSKRQAEAYVLREIEAVPRATVAEDMGISTSSLDGHVQRAKRKLDAAETTLERIDDYRTADVPERCMKCGGSLGARWTQTAAGEPLCLECSGLDPDAI